VERFNNFVLVIAREDKPTVVVKRLDVSSEEELYIMCSIICLINDDDLVLRFRRKRNS
jgi:hypothetical protein